MAETESLKGDDWLHAIATGTYPFRRYCNDCGNEFEKLSVGYGCKRCWQKNNFLGPLPQDAAPCGLMAATGIMRRRRPSARTTGHQRRNADGGSSGQETRATQRSIDKSYAHARRPLDKNPSLPAIQERRGSGVMGALTIGRSESSAATSSSRTPQSRTDHSALGSTKSLPSLRQPANGEAISGASGIRFFDASGRRRSLGRRRKSRLEQEQTIRKIQAKPGVRKVLDAMLRVLRAKQVNPVELFRMLDRNGDRALNHAEMLVGFHKLLGVEVSSLELTDFFKLLDNNSNKEVEFNEFYEVLRLYEGSLREETGKPVELDTEGFCGWKEGTRVQTKVRMPKVRHPKNPREDALDAARESTDTGKVVGPGLERNTVMVQLDSGKVMQYRSHQLLALPKEGPDSWRTLKESQILRSSKAGA